MTDKSGAWEVLLGEGIGPLRLGTSKEVISKIEGFAEPELVQDESAAVSDFEKLLNSMGPEMGLDPEEFKEMIAGCRLKLRQRFGGFPKPKACQLFFFTEISLFVSFCRPSAVQNLKGEIFLRYLPKNFMNW